MPVSILTWEQIHAKRYAQEPFALDPYIPSRGITFLFAPTSVGKSALMFKIAACVGEGEPFFGLPTTKGRVLIIELDTPEQLVAPRIQAPNVGAPPKDVWFAFCPPLSIPMVRPDIHEALKKARDLSQPSLVIINTLRKAHTLDDKNSNVPSIVYGYFLDLFPESALLFIHHTKKQPPSNIEVVEREMFSGSNAWISDAQSAIYLQPWKQAKRRRKGEKRQELYCSLRLCHAKSQVAPLYKPLPLLLEDDGTNWRCPVHEEMLITQGIVENGKVAGLSGHKIDEELAEALAEAMGQAYSVSTARRKRLLIEEGLFPGSREFLGRENRSGKEEGEGEEGDEGKA